MLVKELVKSTFNADPTKGLKKYSDLYNAEVNNHKLFEEGTLKILLVNNTIAVYNTCGVLQIRPLASLSMFKNN